MEIADGFRGGVCRCSDCRAMIQVPDNPAATVHAVYVPELAETGRVDSTPPPLPKSAQSEPTKSNSETPPKHHNKLQIFQWVMLGLGGVAVVGFFFGALIWFFTKIGG
jgi:hypothetical protein